MPLFIKVRERRKITNNKHSQIDAAPSQWKQRLFKDY